MRQIEVYPFGIIPNVIMIMNGGGKSNEYGVDIGFRWGLQAGSKDFRARARTRARARIFAP